MQSFEKENKVKSSFALYPSFFRHLSLLNHFIALSSHVLGEVRGAFGVQTLVYGNEVSFDIFLQLKNSNHYWWAHEGLEVQDPGHHA